MKKLKPRRREVLRGLLLQAVSLRYLLSSCFPASHVLELLGSKRVDRHT